MLIAVGLNAGPDRNGNPRRGWLVYQVEPVGPRSDLLGWVEDTGGEYTLREALGYEPGMNSDKRPHVLCCLDVSYRELRIARSHGKVKVGE